MDASTAYTAIDSKKGTPPERTCFYMMNCLLYSRMESGFPSNDDYFDEDVNVYLANLLSSLIDPEYQKHLTRHISSYDVDVYECVEAVTDPRTKLVIYKSNADYLLVSLGMFMNPTGRRPHSVPHMNLPPDAYIGRGKMYYRLAQSFALETHHKNRAISDILGKLSCGFEKYINVLTLLRGEYFNLLKRFSPGEVYHLERSIESGPGEAHRHLKELYDEFLDVYSRYKREKTAESKELLETISQGIRRLDPSFRFTVE